MVLGRNHVIVVLFVPSCYTGLGSSTHLHRWAKDTSIPLSTASEGARLSSLHIYDASVIKPEEALGLNPIATQGWAQIYWNLGFVSELGRYGITVFHHQCCKPLQPRSHFHLMCYVVFDHILVWWTVIYIHHHTITNTWANPGVGVSCRHYCNSQKSRVT